MEVRSAITIVCSATGSMRGTKERHKPPKVGVDGEKIYTCTICGEKKTEKIPQLPKKWGSLEGDGVTYVVGIQTKGLPSRLRQMVHCILMGRENPLQEDF